MDMTKKGNQANRNRMVTTLTVKATLRSSRTRFRIDSSVRVLGVLSIRARAVLKILTYTVSIKTACNRNPNVNTMTVLTAVKANNLENTDNIVIAPAVIQAEITMYL